MQETEDEHFDSDMQTLKANHKHMDNIKSKNYQVQSRSRPKRDNMPTIKLDLWYINWIVYQYIGYFLIETDCTQVATQWRVNAAIFNIHVSEPFISFNSF